MKNKKVNIICSIAIVLLVGITIGYQKISLNNLTTDIKNLNNESSYIVIFVISAFLIFLSLLLYLFIDRFQSLSVKNEIKEQKVENPINNFSDLEFKKEVFDLYKRIKEAYTERNSIELKELLSEELYEAYENKIKEEQEKEIKSNIENITMEDINLLSVRDNINYYEIDVKVKLIYKSYVTNSDNFIVKGDVSKDNSCYLKLTVVKNKRLKDINNCPHCYHILEDYESNKCKYCNSIIVESSDTLRLAKEEKVKK